MNEYEFNDIMEELFDEQEDPEKVNEILAKFGLLDDDKHLIEDEDWDDEDWDDDEDW